MARRVRVAPPPTALEREREARRWTRIALARLIPACDPGDVSPAILLLEAARREALKLIASLDRDGLPPPRVAAALREQLLAGNLERVVAYADARVEAQG
jgi:hypothetical protein